MTAMTSEREALLPCPFCGSATELDKGEFGEIFAACTKCWCDMGSAWSMREADAIEAWNRRAHNVPDAKPLPDLMMASYHEAVGWNACRAAMLAALTPKDSR